MSIDLQELEKSISNLKDEGLRKIIYMDNANYESDAISIVKNELFNRYPMNIWESENTTLKDVILCVTYKELEEEIVENFPEVAKHMEKYRSVFNRLEHSMPMKNDELRISIAIPSMDVLGEDIKSEDKITLRYCKWEEWAGFLIKNEQLQLMGKEKYVVYCLIEMTAAGFDEEAIEKCFNDTVNAIEVVHENLDIEPTDLIGNANEMRYDKIADRGHELINELSDRESSQIRPWVRYWARHIDTLIFSCLMICIIQLFHIQIKMPVAPLLLSFIITLSFAIIWLFIEAFLLSKWGYTPGKWILNVSVRDASGSKLTYNSALNRACMVLLYGSGLLIPLVGMITNIMSYTKLTEEGRTKWDRKGNYIVSHKEIGIVRSVIAIIIIVGLSTILGRL